MKPLLVAIALLASLTGVAQVREGKYRGDLNFMGQKLPLVLNLTYRESSLTATLDSPLQGAYDIPTDEVTYEESDRSLRVVAGSLDMTFVGTIKGDSISGTFAQRGLKLPLVLVREQDQPAPETLPYDAKEVTFESKGAKLSGTLTMPRDQTATTAVVLVSGSGPQNRDEELLRIKPFADIADHLTRAGYIVLRYDDRGVGRSTGDFASATTEDFVEDARAGVAFARSVAGVKKVGLLGHSEGGLVAEMLAAEEETPLDFIILMAAPGVPSADIISYQNLQSVGLYDRLSEEERKDFYDYSRHFWTEATRPGADTLAVVRDYASRLAEMAPEPTRLTKEMQEMSISRTVATLRESPWYSFFIRLDPGDYLPKIAIPVLVLNGERDRQVVASENVPALKAGLTHSPSVTIRTYPTLNHLFVPCETGSPTEYPSLTGPIAEEVRQDMVDWLGSLYSPSLEKE